MPTSSTRPVKRITKRAMDHWENNFPELTDFAKKEIYANIMKEGVKKITARAGVKSGKRYLAIIFAAYTGAGSDGLVANVFLSCYKRNSDNNQRFELENYMHVCSVNTKKSATECLNLLKSLSKNYKTIVIHYDEFDHGSGIDQLMGVGSDANLWDYIISNTKVKVIKYSASPEEGIVADPDEMCLLMPDHPNYRGARHFIEKGLVYEAENPIVKDDNGDICDISDQVKRIIEDAKVEFKSNCGKKPLLVIRVADDFAGFAKIVKEGKIPDLVYNPDDEDAIAVHCEFVASTESATTRVPWDDYQFWKTQSASAKRAKEVRIFFIDKECMRSTDWFLHPFLFAYHDYHGKASALNTVIQSNLRVAYFTGKKDSEGNTLYPDEDLCIRLYGDTQVLEYVAGRQSLESVRRKVSSRAVVAESDPTTFGLPFRLQLTDEQLMIDYMQGSLNDSKRNSVKQLLLGLPGLTNQQREIIQNRSLLHRRRYTAENEIGGIHTVHKRYVECRVSKPGGGVECPSENWNNRDKYFWMDYTTENTGDIPKGIVYITYGNPDDDDAEPSFNHRISQSRDGIAQSVFSNHQTAEIPMA